MQQAKVAAQSSNCQQQSSNVIAGSPFANLNEPSTFGKANNQPTPQQSVSPFGMPQKNPFGSQPAPATNSNAGAQVSLFVNQ